MKRSLIQSIVKPLQNHWYGRNGLLVSLLLSLIGLRVALYVGQTILPPFSNNPALAFWVLINVAILIWQVVGTHRAADKHLLAHGDMLSVWAGFLAILFATVLTVVQIVDILTPAAPPEVLEHKNTGEEVYLRLDGRTVVLTGSLSFEMNNAFVEILSENPTVTTVELDSNGGLVHAARALARHILDKQLNTHVKTLCYSACTIPFIAGRHRTLDSGADLGFHRYAIDNPNPLFAPAAGEEQLKDQAFFAAQGISESFLKQILATPHGDIWRPQRAELLQAGVITEQPSGR